MNLLNITLQKPNILNSPQERQRVPQDWKPIATTSLIKPDRPNRSYIVREPFYMAPVNFVTDIKENLVNIKNGIMGKSNDHDLGRINDFAMKAGALGLAGYLFTRGKTAQTKAMEFVGFGTFFASMALWPKLFIQAPIKAMHGLDIHQRYVDNEGRKKMFFQDPQYIPWDLYTDEDLSKLGDKLGVPRDIHNRNEVIKKKAHKIALQGNTLWMLTAGFATPLMSALMCNAVEKIVTPRSDKHQFPDNIFGATGAAIEQAKIDRFEARLSNVGAEVSNKLDDYNPKGLNAALALDKDSCLTPEKVEKLATRLAHDPNDVLLKEYVKTQLEEILTEPVRTVNDDYAKKFGSYLRKLQTDLNEGALRNGHKPLDLSVITDDDLQKLAKQNLSIPAFNKRIIALASSRLGESMGAEREEINKACRDFAAANGKKMVLSTENIQRIRKLDKGLYEYSVRKGLLEGYYSVYFNNAPETVAANRWNNFSMEFLKSIGMTAEEIEQVKMGESSANEILLKKLDVVTRDDKSYERAVRRVQAAILEYDKTVLPNTQNGVSQGVKKTLEQQYRTLYESMAERFRADGFEKISDRLVGDKVTSNGSLVENSIDRLSRRTSELRNGMYKVLHVLDFFRRTSNIEEGSKFAQDYMRASVSHSGVNLKPTMDTLRKDVALYRQLLLNGTIADYTTKMGYQNPQLGLYDRLMKLIYSTDLDAATKKILGVGADGLDESAKLGDTTFFRSFTKTIKDALVNLGNFANPHADKVTVRGEYGSVGDILVRDSLAGPRIDRIGREVSSQLFNSSKWFKTFGGMTAALVGITLLSETFFGRLSKEDVQGRKDNH